MGGEWLVDAVEAPRGALDDGSAYAKVCSVYNCRWLNFNAARSPTILTNSCIVGMRVRETSSITPRLANAGQSRIVSDGIEPDAAYCS